MTGSAPEYQYTLKDHLGNTRITFTTETVIDEYNATMESAHATEESADFPNYNDVTISAVTLYNHTTEAGATNSVVLNGAVNKQVGLAKSLRVVPGDVIDITAYAKYFKPGSTQESVGTFIATALTAAFGLEPGINPLEASHYQAINTIFSEGWLVGPGEWEDDDAPKAYLNYILFDEDMVPYDMGWDQISISADVTQGGQHDQMILEAKVRKPGYAYIYMSNEDDEIVEVYFDDFSISHQHSDVIQQDDYYPFGLTFNSYSRETSVPQDLKFNGKEAQNELGLGWLDYGARMYIPDIGRWGVTDPHADSYYSVSPYSFSISNPVNFVDPTGKDFVAIIEQDKKGNYTITIKTTVHTYGKDSSKDQAKAWTEGFKKLGTEKKLGSEGQHTVKFDVTYEHHDSKEEAMQAVENNRGDNLMQIDESLSNKELSNFAYYGQQEEANDLDLDVTPVGRKESNVRRKEAVYHSTGHLLGLGERYVGPDTDLRVNGFDNDIMSANLNPTEVHRQHYLNLSDFSIRNRDTAEKTDDPRVNIYRDRGRIDRGKK